MEPGTPVDLTLLQNFSRPLKLRFRERRTRLRFQAWAFPPAISSRLSAIRPAISLMVLVAIVIVIIGLLINSFWLVLSGSIVALLLSLRVLLPLLQPILAELGAAPEQSICDRGGRANPSGGQLAQACRLWHHSHDLVQASRLERDRGPR